MAPPFTSYMESALGRLLYPLRGRDPQLLTRACPAISCLPPTLTVASPSELLIDHTPLGANEFPGLSWSLPADVNEADVKGFLLVVEDADAPVPFPIVHGIYHGLPASRTSVRPEDFKVVDEEGDRTGSWWSWWSWWWWWCKRKPTSTLLKGGFHYGSNIFGSVWGGPKPVISHGPHRYFFQVVALKELEVKDGEMVGKQKLLEGALEGKVLAWGEWVGSFERKLE